MEDTWAVFESVESYLPEHVDRQNPVAIAQYMAGLIRPRIEEHLESEDHIYNGTEDGTMRSEETDLEAHQSPQAEVVQTIFQDVLIHVGLEHAVTMEACKELRITTTEGFRKFEASLHTGQLGEWQELKERLQCLSYKIPSRIKKARLVAAVADIAEKNDMREVVNLVLNTTALGKYKFSEVYQELHRRRRVIDAQRKLLWSYSSSFQADTIPEDLKSDVNRIWTDMECIVAALDAGELEDGGVDVEAELLPQLRFDTATDADWSRLIEICEHYDHCRPPTHKTAAPDLDRRGDDEGMMDASVTSHPDASVTHGHMVDISEGEDVDVPVEEEEVKIEEDEY